MRGIVDAALLHNARQLLDPSQSWAQVRLAEGHIVACMNRDASAEFQDRIREFAALYKKGVGSQADRHRGAGGWLRNTAEAIQACDERGACGIRVAPGFPGYVSGLGERVDRAVPLLPTLRNLLAKAEQHNVCLQSGVSRPDRPRGHWYDPEKNAVELAGFPGPGAAVHELSHAKNAHEPPSAASGREPVRSLGSLRKRIISEEARTRLVECQTIGEMRKHGHKFDEDIQESLDWQSPGFEQTCGDYLARRISRQEATKLIADDMPNFDNQAYERFVRDEWKASQPTPSSTKIAP